MDEETHRRVDEADWALARSDARIVDRCYEGRENRSRRGRPAREDSRAVLDHQYRVATIRTHTLAPMQSQIL